MARRPLPGALLKGDAHENPRRSRPSLLAAAPRADLSPIVGILIVRTFTFVKRLPWLFVLTITLSTTPCSDGRCCTEVSLFLNLRRRLHAELQKNNPDTSFPVAAYLRSHFLENVDSPKLCRRARW